MPRISRFVVVGLFDSGMAEYDAASPTSPSPTRSGSSTWATRSPASRCGLHDLYQAEPRRPQLRGTLGTGYRVRDWMEANHNLFAALKLQKTVYFIVLLLIILVAAFTIVATLIMVVMEKRKDIAILKSMGASGRRIGRIFIFKGLIIGVVGTLLGNLGGYAGCWLLKHYQFIELPEGRLLRQHRAGEDVSGVLRRGDRGGAVDLPAGNDLSGPPGGAPRAGRRDPLRVRDSRPRPFGAPLILALHADFTCSGWPSASGTPCRLRP